MRPARGLPSAAVALSKEAVLAQIDDVLGSLGRARRASPYDALSGGLSADEMQGGYKDTAAVIAGSTLEEHLDKLAAKLGVAVAKPGGSPVKADTLNAELTKTVASNALCRNRSTAWLDLRNKAASELSAKESCSSGSEAELLCRLCFSPALPSPRVRTNAFWPGSVSRERYA